MFDLTLVEEYMADSAAALLDHDRETFNLRLERWWDDLTEGLGVFGEAFSEDHMRRLLSMMIDYVGKRSPELKRLDEARVLRPNWFQSEKMVGYATYVDRFAGTLRGVQERIGYLEDLGVTYLHLMPLLEPRPGDSDGGYAVQNYMKVRSDLGSMEDLEALASSLRAKGISLVMDLVLNHVAMEHEWATKAKEGDEHYRDFFLIFPDREIPDQFEETLPEVFPDFAPGNFTFDDSLNGWVWTTFNSFQWDLNWANPEVFLAFIDVILSLANRGVEVLRLDAIAFLWKRMGTDCQNQPEVHEITKALRAVARVVSPGLIFKAEAIVGPSDLISYLGVGHNRGKVCDIAYHNSLMVQIWSMFASRDVRLGAVALSKIPPKSETSAWITYLRCHDDIGWAIDDKDAASVGLDGFAHRKFLSDFYSGDFFGSYAEGLVFQANPDTGDRRISGSAASLAGLSRAGDNIDLVDLAIARVVASYSLVMSFGGIPVIWMGDEIALLNDYDWDQELGHQGDNRWVHRPKMKWEIIDQIGKNPLAQRVLSKIRHLVAVRKSLPQLEASVEAEVLDIMDPSILPLVRRHHEGSILILTNVSEGVRYYPISEISKIGISNPFDALTSQYLRADQNGYLRFEPYDHLWIIQGA
ncbi:MAG: alpha-amylase family protein [Actinomycetota bacterium]|nr:alpha-amylase family protein [Actinomycetota bacterium]